MHPAAASLTRATLITLLASACTLSNEAPPRDISAGFDLQAACAAIAARNVEFTTAHVSGDVAAIDAIFTRDARSLPPGGDPVTGVAALHDFTVEYLKSGVKEFRETTSDCRGNAQLVVDEGEYVVVYGPDSTTERGKYLNVWTQEDGVWKIRTNIWNTSPAALATAK